MVPRAISHEPGGGQVAKCTYQHPSLEHVIYFCVQKMAFVLYVESCAVSVSSSYHVSTAIAVYYVTLLVKSELMLSYTSINIII